MNFKTFLLIIVIALLGTFIYLKTESLGDDSSSFNQTTRISLGKHSFFRNVLSLHKDGDGRAEYLLGTNAISVEIVQAQGNPLSDKVVEQFRTKVEQVTGKKVALYNIDTIQNGVLTDSDVQQIVKVKRKHSSLGESNLFVIYADDFVSTGNELAKTYDEFGMVLSNDRLVKLTGKYSGALEQYQLSTMMHELGHQLGLPHNDQVDCIMNKEVESPSGILSLNGKFTVTDYCQFELDQVDQTKASLK